MLSLGLVKLLDLMGSCSEASRMSVELSQVKFACNGEEEKVQMGRVMLISLFYMLLDFG